MWPDQICINQVNVAKSKGQLESMWLCVSSSDLAVDSSLDLLSVMSIIQWSHSVYEVKYPAEQDVANLTANQLKDAAEAVSELVLSVVAAASVHEISKWKEIGSIRSIKIDHLLDFYSCE